MVFYYRPEVQGTSYNKQIQFHSKRDGKRITESIHQILNYVKKEVLELKRFLTGAGWKFEINVRYLQSPW